ncbi:MAG: VacJ family lipoprotein [Desulfobulbaceae bacterium]|nr:VacJ family lipoprotein [Desulfobulbaceae bacterium]MCK5341208.1 VacJ family lipoprotein [Desulfobulbaceae bacterium]
MPKKRCFVPVVAVFLMCSLLFSLAQASDAKYDSYFEDNESAEISADRNGSISDPLEPVNRAFFHFNDKLYFWLLKPVAQVYGAVLPEDIRGCIKNAFHNLMAPVRIVNNLLQGKFAASGTEMSRFLINSTAGVYGLGDPAKEEFGLETKDEDLGQTLGVYGLGGGIYICWPFLGPSNVRDTIGFVGDSFLNPTSYLSGGNTSSTVAINAGKQVNATSLSIGDYEDFKEAAYDPYVALRDGYEQHRNSRIKDIRRPSEEKIFSSRKGDRSVSETLSEMRSYASREKNDKDRIPSLFEREFFVHVGTFVNHENVMVLREKLLELDKTPRTTVHDRGDYKYYGVEVPGGRNFMAAKVEEKFMLENGFPEAFVVAR